MFGKKKAIKIEGGGRVPSRSKNTAQNKKSRIIPEGHVLPTEDDETINKVTANMSGRRYNKRTKAQIITDRSPRVYKDIREQD